MYELTRLTIKGSPSPKAILRRERLSHTYLKSIGVFRKSQVGYARVISDKTRFAYIVDVYVDENCRKQGIGQKMINYILTSDELKDVYQWLLITKDAHEVYSKVGFQPISHPLAWMEIRNQRPSR